jgi:hypothetical protein
MSVASPALLAEGSQCRRRTTTPLMETFVSEQPLALALLLAIPRTARPSGEQARRIVENLLLPGINLVRMHPCRFASSGTVLAQRLKPNHSSLHRLRQSRTFHTLPNLEVGPGLDVFQDPQMPGIERAGERLANKTESMTGRLQRHDQIKSAPASRLCQPPSAAISTSASFGPQPPRP